MRKYEGLFVYPPEETGTSLKEAEKRLEEQVQHFGGKVLERRDWGRRLLGFPLRKHREGHLLIWNFEMNPLQLGEFRKALELDEKILKSTLVKVPEMKPRKEAPARKPKERVHGRESQ